MKWGKPSRIKIFEALGAVADERVEILSRAEARVFSSSRGKYYTVRYDPENQAIMSNDNAAYWQGTLGYPAIAFLLVMGALSYRRELAQSLRGIPWKDLNSRFKNDYEKTLKYVKKQLSEEAVLRLEEEIDRLEREIEKLGLTLLGAKERPPAGY